MNAMRVPPGDQWGWYASMGGKVPFDSRLRKAMVQGEADICSGIERNKRERRRCRKFSAATLALGWCVVLQRYNRCAISFGLVRPGVRNHARCGRRKESVAPGRDVFNIRRGVPVVAQNLPPFGDLPMEGSV